jgi:hypothetical protein
MRKKPIAKARAKKRVIDSSSTVETTPSGGHKWTIRWQGEVVTARTSSSTVAAIAEVASDFEQALKRLAKK